jgi:WD40 repeat protein
MALPRSIFVFFVLAIVGGLTVPAISQDGKPKPAPLDQDEPLIFDNNSQSIQTSQLFGWACCISQDGSTLVSCAGITGQSGEIQIWDLKEQKIRLTIKHESGIRAIAISPDSKMIAAGCFDKSMRLYDLASGRLLAIGAGHQNGIAGIAFTSDGKTLVTAGLDRTVKVWQTPVCNPKAAKAVEFKPFASLEEHTGRVYSVVVTKDGQSIASVSDDRTARIWDMPKPSADGKPVVIKKSRRLLQGHNMPAESIALSPDNRLLATGSRDGQVKIWDMETGTEQRTIAGANGSVLAVAFSADGQTLITGAGNSGSRNPGEVRQFSLDDNVGYDLRLPQPNTVRGLATTPDGKFVASACEDRSIHLIEIGESAKAQDLKPEVESGLEPQIVMAVAWSPDSNSLAYAGENKWINLRDQKTGKSRKWLAHDDVIACLAFSPDGKSLASASYDRLVKIWDVANWVPGTPSPPVRVLRGHTNWVFSVAFSSDGRKLASGSYDKSVRIWNLAPDQDKIAPSVVISGREGHSAAVWAVAFMPGDREIVSAGGDRTIRFWDVATGNDRGVLRGHKGAIRALAVSRNGEILASGSEDQTVKLWRLKRGADKAILGEEKSELTGQGDIVTSIVFSPKERTLAVATWNGSIHLWDPSIARQRRVMGGFGQPINVIAFAPNGQKLATGGYDQSVHIWSQNDSRPSPLVAYEGHDQAVTAIALSNDGRLTATGDFNGCLRIFDRFGKQRFMISPAHVGGITGLAFSPGGQKLASIGFDRTIRFWNVETGEQSSPIPAPSGEVSCLAYSPDGRFLASAGKDKIVTIRDARTGQELKRLAGHSGEIKVVAFSPDGMILVSAGADRTFRLWDVKKNWALKSELPANGNNGGFMSAAFSVDGAVLALAHNQDQVISPDGQLEQQQFRQVMLVDVATGKPKQDALNRFAHADWVTGVAVMADGQTLATTSRDGYLRFWEIGTGRMMRQVLAHQAAINAMAIDRRADQIATAGDDRIAALWPWLLNEEGSTVSLSGQNGEVRFAEYSQDGSMLATGGNDHVVRVRKGIPGSQPFRFAQPFGACFSLAVSPDGSIIASGHGDGSINLWDSATGKRIKTLKGHKETVWSVSFLADGKRLVASSGSWNRREEEPGEVKLWDVEKAKVIREYAGHAGAVYVAMPSPDGKTLATGSQDKTIRIWDLESGKLRQTLKGQGGGVRTLAFLDQGKTLVSGSHEEATFIFWSVDAGKETSRQTLPDANSRINRLRVSPDGKSLAVVVTGQSTIAPPVEAVAPPAPSGYYAPPMPAPEAGTLQIWDLAAKKFKSRSSNGRRMLDCAYSPDGALIVTVGGIFAELGEICIWNSRDGGRLGELHGHKRWLEAVAFTKNGRLITGGGINQAVQMRVPQSPVPVATAKSEARPPAMEPGEMRIWDVAGFQANFQMKGHTNPVTCGAFSPDGKLLATGARGGSVLVSKIESAGKGKPIEKLNLKQNNALSSVCFSPDGRTLAAGDEVGQVKLWNPLTGDLVRAIDAHSTPVHALAFSSDGQTLVSAAGDSQSQGNGEVKFWDVASGKLKGELEKHPRAVWSIAFAPKSSWLATACGDGGIRIYDVNSRKLLHTIRNMSGIRTVAFSPDGALLAAGHMANNDPKIRLWETDTWRERATLSGHSGSVYSVRFAPDGKTLASASRDGSVKIWNVPDRKNATSTVKEMRKVESPAK